MEKLRRGPFFPVAVFLIAAFGVFVLPFLFPPGLTSAVSVSNAAGFNNKIAAVAAAACAVLVFAFSWWGWAGTSVPAVGALPASESIADRMRFWRPWIVAGLLLSGVIAVAAWWVCASGLMYDSDVGWLSTQMRSAVEYHRTLYAEIEYPYGPLLFYPPILLHAVLAPWQVSLRVCYFVYLVLSQLLGVLLLGYVVSKLPLTKGWRTFVLCCFVPFSLQPMLGLNYTWARFIALFALLLFCMGQKKVSVAASLLAVGVMVTLGIGPEMGFAFAAGAVVYSVLQIRAQGRKWGLALLSVPLGAGVFVLWAGMPYFRKFGLFAGGENNFIVEPQPYIFLFLAGLIWLVPRMLAGRLRRFEHQDIELASFFVAAVALVPVALGRCDPGHLFFNGIGIFLLSFVAMTPLKRWQQMAFGAAVAATVLLGYGREVGYFRWEVQKVLSKNALDHPQWVASRLVLAVRKAAGSKDLSTAETTPPESAFDADALARLTHGEKVATPFSISLEVEEKLRARQLYRPDFFFFMYDVLDEESEKHKMAYVDEGNWALISTGSLYLNEETQAIEDGVVGIPLPYKAKHAPHLVGELLEADFQKKWEPAAEFGPYTAWHRRGPSASPAGVTEGR